MYQSRCIRFPVLFRSHVWQFGNRQYHSKAFSSLQHKEERMRYVEQVDGLFTHSSKLSEHWKEPLLGVSKAAAREMVSLLDTMDCPMGFDFNTESVNSNEITETAPFVEFCRSQKTQRPESLILARSNDVYRAYGVDALLSVEHANLEPKDGLAVVEFSRNKIQSVLDQLVVKNGFPVAVIEESNKRHFLSQLVTQASPLYQYGITMTDEGDSSEHAARPFVGIFDFDSGYTLVEVGLESRQVRVQERLTPDALACHMNNFKPANPAWLVPAKTDDAKKRNRSISKMKELVPVSTTTLDRAHVPDETSHSAGADRAKDVILTRILAKWQYHHKKDGALGKESSSVALVRRESFLLVQNPGRTETQAVTNHVDLPTATQLGFNTSNDKIPPLLDYVVSEKVACREFVKRWLLIPPPSAISHSMADLVQFSQGKDAGSFTFSVPSSLGRLLDRVRNQEADAGVFRQLHRALIAAHDAIPRLTGNSLGSFMKILEYETGLGIRDHLELRNSCKKAAEEIESIVVINISPAGKNLRPPDNEDDDDSFSAFGEGLAEFLKANENSWRGRVQEAAAQEMHDEIDQAKDGLRKAISEDFSFLTDGPSSAVTNEEDYADEETVSCLEFDPARNVLAVYGDVPKGMKKKFKPMIDPRSKKRSKKGLTTKRVEESMNNFVSLCEDAPEKIAALLKGLCATLHDSGHMPVLYQALHANLILSTAMDHGARAKILGWHRAEVEDGVENDKCSLDLKSVWPYWMNKHKEVKTVCNNIEMKGMWVLTGPNMAGKSCLMRSVAAAALLSVCGFCAPLQIGSSLVRFDSMALRGASSDVPTEGKSAFGAEMADISSLLRGCGSKSLVFVDELARGTSPTEGTALAAAILQEMNKKGMTGVFATHLHGILDLPLEGADVSRKQMSIDPAGEDMWTFKLGDGVCRNSLALVTAKKFGIAPSILSQTKKFVRLLDSSLALLEESVSESIIEKAESPSDFDRLKNLAEELTGKSGTAVPPGSTHFSSLEGESCLYILEVLRGGVAWCYIGQTDNFRQRLAQHRGATSRELGCYVFVVSDKSEAEKKERLLINTARHEGIPLINK